MLVRGKGRVVLLATGVALAFAGGVARADDTAVISAVEHPPAQTTTYAAKDDRGTSLDGLDVLQVAPHTYLGVHHTVANGRFEVHLVTSQDLRAWRFVRVLGRDAAMPALAAAPGGGFVLADERGSTLGFLPTIALPAAIAGPTNLWMLEKTQLRFRFYPSYARLAAGRPAAVFVAPLTLSPTNEGTPSITVSRDGPGLAGLQIDAGFHYFADLTGDGVPDADRQATGRLMGFASWASQRRQDIDGQLLNPAALHDGFAQPPAGSIGDRDDVTLPDGSTATITEAQYKRADFATWRLFLRDRAGGPATPLTPVTPGGSRAFGNPSLTLVTDPDGNPALVFTAFVFGEAAGPGEAGELVSITPL